MSDILEEVLRDHSDEKKIYYFRKILPIVISFSIMVVALLLYNNWYKDRQLANQMRASDKFFDILLSNPEIDKNAYKNLDDIIVDRSSNVSALASLEQIGVQLKQNNLSQAKILLEKIIFNNDYDQLTKAYAYMSWLSLVTNSSDLSSDDKEKFEKSFSFFDDEEEYPFRGTINLLRALWWIQNNQHDNAIKILQKVIKFDDAASSTKEQAKALLNTVK